MTEEPARKRPRPTSEGAVRSLTALRWTVYSLIAATVIALTVIHLSRGDQIILFSSSLAGLAAAATIVEIALRTLQVRLKREGEELRTLWSRREVEFEEIAGRDDLTQLQNRRFFYERLQEELAETVRQRKSLSILMLDVDDLKAINDEFGHQVGDAVLRAFGRILNAHARPDYLTARLGGDEFAVVMPDAGRREADALAWRIWEDLSKSPIYETENASIYLGVSIGSSGYPWGGRELEEIIHWADTKLYANKLERKGFKQGPGASKDSRLVSAVVDVLSTALDIRDQMTHRHARRVARMAAWIAREMELSPDQVLEVQHAAALHDIGKIGVADSILRKGAPLDEEEWKEMRRHPELGYHILKGIDFLADAAEIVHAHHERFDGNGYPQGLAGTEIPLGARVFAVVDAYDAMTSRRPYRDAMSREAALIEVARNAGTQFDPRVVDCFLRMIRRNPEGFRDEEHPFGSRIEGPELAASQVGQRERRRTSFVPVDNH
jgi:diguanylate cyclase (GGDEF)-like protein